MLLHGCGHRQQLGADERVDLLIREAEARTELTAPDWEHEERETVKTFVAAVPGHAGLPPAQRVAVFGTGEIPWGWSTTAVPRIGWRASSAPRTRCWKSNTRHGRTRPPSRFSPQLLAGSA